MLTLPRPASVVKQMEEISYVFIAASGKSWADYAQVLVLLKAAGMTCTEARSAGFRPRMCKEAGFSFKEAKEAGYAYFELHWNRGDETESVPTHGWEEES